jgi:hypothetical protein
MKTITLNIEDDAHKELTNALGLRNMLADNIGVDYQFIFRILFEMYKNSDSVTITKELLEQGMINVRS